MGKQPEMEAETPQELSPLYASQDVNEPVELYEGRMCLTVAAKPPLSGQGQVSVQWTPFPAVYFDLSLAEYMPVQITSSDVRLDASEIGVGCKVLLTGMTASNTGTQYRGIAGTPIVVGETADCDEIRFALPNFFSFFGHQIRDSDATTFWGGRLRLQNRDLALVVDAGPSAKDLVGKLTRERGYGITHTGSIKRKGGESIGFDEAEEILDSLYWLFSFCRGFRCGPILPVGRSGGKEVWRKWDVPDLAVCKAVETWFPYQDPLTKVPELDELFEGFRAKWEDVLWQEPIREAIHWYCTSNLGSAGIEGSVILTQTALELLSWVRLVEDPTTQKFSKTEFDGHMHADCRIRELLMDCGIPALDIPAGLGALQAEATQLGATDGPSAIVKIRNALVHPRVANRERVSTTSPAGRGQALDLGLWYLEMVLLRLFNYSGIYYNRWTHGRVRDCRRRVPWA